MIVIWQRFGQIANCAKQVERLCLNLSNRQIIDSCIGFSLLQTMSSDIFDEPPYSSVTSSPQLQSSYEAKRGSQLGIQNHLRFKEQVQTVEKQTHQLFSEINVDNIVVSKCLAPTQLLKQKEQLIRKIKNANIELAQMNQMAMGVDLEINQVKAEIQASKRIEQLLKLIQDEVDTTLNTQQRFKLPAKEKTGLEVQAKLMALDNPMTVNLKQRFEKLAKEETNLEVQVKLMALDKELEMKKKNDAQLKEFLAKKIADEKQRIQNLKNKISELKERHENENSLDQQLQEQSIKAKDGKLVADRVRMLQSNIERLKKNLQMK